MTGRKPFRNGGARRDRTVDLYNAILPAAIRAIRAGQAVMTSAGSLRRSRGPIIALLLTALSACATHPESAWQTLHAIDAAQTMAIAMDDCYEEQDPITRRIIGRHPEPLAVVGWWAASAAGHLWVSSRLEGRWLAAWQAITIIGTGNAVINNHGVGIRIGTGNRVEDSGGACAEHFQSAHQYRPASPWRRR